ncbi:carbohydrate ABC transporter permease [Cognatishimia sp. SS12]|uniref:carbohydrate ABC transporter permease n=1 Tax=Cognatishimia sp. SS12 TaxID=2979465 RepID=UPI00232C8E7B|nr:carbohydrate ABC transporter permease [Cognatishimia sp. SS12]MDC0739604.1 carbohydrate ABC transporter permease [Cognatishimia sp. SS12]
MTQIDTNTLSASGSEPDRGSMFERFEEPVVRSGQIGLLLLLAAIFFMPIFGSLLTSIRTIEDITTNGSWALPSSYEWENLQIAFIKMLPFLKASTIITLPSVAGTLLVATMAGYALSRLRFQGRLWMFLVIVSLSFVPIHTQLIPVFRLISEIGLHDTFIAQIIVHIMRHIPFAVLIMTNFFNTVPGELREAARIDGANEWTIFRRVYAPIARPAISALVVLEFTWIWNDLLWGLVLTQGTGKKPVTVGILSFQGEYEIAYNMVASGAVIAAIPTLAVFLIFQKQFIRGMTMGSVKG